MECLWIRIVFGRGLDMAMDKSRSRSIHELTKDSDLCADMDWTWSRTSCGHGRFTDWTRTWTDRVCGHCVDIPGQCADMPRLLLGYRVEIARTLLAIVRTPCGCCVDITRKLRRTSRRTLRGQMRVHCADILWTFAGYLADTNALTM